MEKRAVELGQSAIETPIDSKNQCDGCNSGLRLDELNLHRDAEGKPVMVCQGYKYE